MDRVEKAIYKAIEVTFVDDLKLFTREEFNQPAYDSIVTDVTRMATNYKATGTLLNREDLQYIPSDAREGLILAEGRVKDYL